MLTKMKTLANNNSQSVVGFMLGGVSSVLVLIGGGMHAQNGIKISLLIWAVIWVTGMIIDKLSDHWARKEQADKDLETRLSNLEQMNADGD